MSDIASSSNFVKRKKGESLLGKCLRGFRRAIEGNFVPALAQSASNVDAVEKMPRVGPAS